MNKKEKIFEFFGQNTQLESQVAIKRVINEFVVTQATAETYYHAWRKEYIKRDSEPLTYNNNSIKVAVSNTAKKADIKTKIAMEKEEKVIQTAELKKDIELRKPEEIKPIPINQDTTIKLIPIMFKGPVFTFAINQDGIKIIDGKSDLVTEDIIQEQQAALKIFKDLYSEKETKGDTL